MKQSNIFFVIVTYNAMPWVDRCLESALNGTKSAEIVVVDNVSKDNTVEYIKANYPQVHLFPQTENLGFGAANNLGIRYALEQGADFVYLLNEDAWIEKNTLEILGICLNILAFIPTTQHRNFLNISLLLKV